MLLISLTLTLACCSLGVGLELLGVEPRYNLFTIDEEECQWITAEGLTSSHSNEAQRVTRADVSSVDINEIQLHNKNYHPLVYRLDSAQRSAEIDKYLRKINCNIQAMQDKHAELRRWTVRLHRIAFETQARHQASFCLDDEVYSGKTEITKCIMRHRAKISQAKADIDICSITIRYLFLTVILFRVTTEDQDTINQLIQVQLESIRQNTDIELKETILALLA